MGKKGTEGSAEAGELFATFLLPWSKDKVQYMRTEDVVATVQTNFFFFQLGDCGLIFMLRYWKPSLFSAKVATPNFPNVNFLHGRGR